MPIYTYICKDCGKKSDFLIRTNNQGEEKTCKKCNSKNLEKTFSTFAVNTSSSKSDLNSSSGGSCPTGTCSTGI